MFDMSFQEHVLVDLFSLELVTFCLLVDQEGIF